MKIKKHNHKSLLQEEEQMRLEGRKEFVRMDDAPRAQRRHLNWTHH